MQFAVHVPLNSLSFGQVSFNLLYEFYKMGLNPSIFKASDQNIDFSAFDFEQEFIDWIIKNNNESFLKHNRNIPCIRLWHINDSIRSYSNKQILLTFHETDQITPIETNILKTFNDFSSKFSTEVNSVQENLIEKVKTAYSEPIKIEGKTENNVTVNVKVTDATGNQVQNNLTKQLLDDVNFVSDLKLKLSGVAAP